MGRNHNEDNLTVLCLRCHTKAHSKSTISHNLSSQEITKLRDEWYRLVETRDASTIAGLARQEYSRWDYINHNRVFELAKAINLNPTDLHDPSVCTLEELGIVDHRGMILPAEKWEVAAYGYLYGSGAGMYLYQYMKTLTDELLSRLVIVDLHKHWNRSELCLILKPGIYIALCGAFYFKTNNVREGRGQDRLGHYRRGGIQLSFAFDAWESTSSSARSMHLAGHRQQTIVAMVKGVIESPALMDITVSCLCIGVLTGKAALGENSEYNFREF